MTEKNKIQDPHMTLPVLSFCCFAFYD